MLRGCMFNKSPVSSRQVNGRTIYQTIEETTVDWLDIFGRLFANSSYYFTTTESTDCMARLENNLSDFTSEFYPPHSTKSFYHVPVPDIALKVLMLTGHDQQDVHVNNATDASESVGLFTPGVYLCSLLFICLFTVYVVIGALFYYQKALLTLKLGVINNKRMGYLERLHRLDKVTSREYVCRYVSHQLKSFYCGSSDQFLWVRMLLSMLSFCLLCHFMSVYSTSKIVLEQPYEVDTYQKLWQHEKSLPFFCDLVVTVSTEFKNAPAQSVKREIWSRFVNSVDDKFKGERSATELISQLPLLYESMRVNRSVIILSSDASGVFKSFLCATRDEEDYRIISIRADPGQREELLGYALTTNYHRVDYFTRKMRILAESGCYEHFRRRFGEEAFTTMSKMIFGASSRHIHQQRLACSEDHEPGVDRNVPSTPLKYYKSIWLLVLGATSNAFIILALEIAIKRSSRSKRRQRRRNCCWAETGRR